MISSGMETSSSSNNGLYVTTIAKTCQVNKRKCVNTGNNLYLFVFLYLEDNCLLFRTDDVNPWADNGTVNQSDDLLWLIYIFQLVWYTCTTNIEYRYSKHDTKLNNPDANQQTAKHKATQTSEFTTCFTISNHAIFLVVALVWYRDMSTHILYAVHKYIRLLLKTAI